MEGVGPISVWISNVIEGADADDRFNTGAAEPAKPHRKVEAKLFNISAYLLLPYQDMLLSTSVCKIDVFNEGDEVSVVLLFMVGVSYVANPMVTCASLLIKPCLRPQASVPH